jgi:hypothetical protein
MEDEWDGDVAEKHYAWCTMKEDSKIRFGIGGTGLHALCLGVEVPQLRAALGNSRFTVVARRDGVGEKAQLVFYRAGLPDEADRLLLARVRAGEAEAVEEARALSYHRAIDAEIRQCLALGIPPPGKFYYVGAEGRYISGQWEGEFAERHFMPLTQAGTAFDFFLGGQPFYLARLDNEDPGLRQYLKMLRYTVLAGKTTGLVFHRAGPPTETDRALIDRVRSGDLEAVAEARRLSFDRFYRRIVEWYLKQRRPDRVGACWQDTDGNFVEAKPTNSIWIKAYVNLTHDSSVKREGVLAWVDEKVGYVGVPGLKALPGILSRKISLFVLGNEVVHFVFGEFGPGDFALIKKIIAGDTEAKQAAQAQCYHYAVEATLAEARQTDALDTLRGAVFQDPRTFKFIRRPPEKGLVIKRGARFVQVGREVAIAFRNQKLPVRGLIPVGNIVGRRGCVVIKNVKRGKPEILDWDFLDEVPRPRVQAVLRAAGRRGARLQKLREENEARAQALSQQELTRVQSELAGVIGRLVREEASRNEKISALAREINACHLPVRSLFTFFRYWMERALGEGGQEEEYRELLAEAYKLEPLLEHPSTFRDFVRVMIYHPKTRLMARQLVAIWGPGALPEVIRMVGKNNPPRERIPDLCKEIDTAAPVPSTRFQDAYRAFCEAQRAAPALPGAASSVGRPALHKPVARYKSIPPELVALYSAALAYHPLIFLTGAEIRAWEEKERVVTRLHNYLREARDRASAAGNNMSRVIRFIWHVRSRLLAKDVPCPFIPTSADRVGLGAKII